MRHFQRAASVLFSFFVLTTAPHAQTSIGGTLSQTELRDFLRQNYSVVTSLGYDTARDHMYGSIDNVGGRVVCVYSGYSKTGTTRAHMNSTGSGGIVQINAEHTWPQSKFNSANPMQSDLHHLYPTWERPNGSRGNNPFAEIDDNESSTWFGGSLLNPISTTIKPAASVITEYSQSVSGRFEPRADHKGNVARTMFYFWTMYAANAQMLGSNASDNAGFFNGMKDVLFKWHREDPVDEKELARTNAIAALQGRPNPFVLDSTLVRRTYFWSVSTDTEANADQPSNVRLTHPYPNPFNPQTSMDVELGRAGEMRVDVVDVMGRPVALLAEGRHAAGRHSLTLLGRNLASGLYLIRVTTTEGVQSRPVMLVK